MSNNSPYVTTIRQRRDAPPKDKPPPGSKANRDKKPYGLKITCRIMKREHTYKHWYRTKKARAEARKDVANPRWGFSYVVRIEEVER